MAGSQREQRSLHVGRSIVEPGQTRARTVQPRKPSDFPHVAQAHLEVAQKLSSPLMSGPPLCEELVAFVQHVFTEEEASLVRHLGTYRGHTAKSLARAEHRPVEEIAPILARLAHEKRVIAASGRNDQEKFLVMPILPGIFESALISENLEDMSSWHRRLAELVEAIYSTGYYGDYVAGGKLPGPFVRVLSVGRSIEAHPMALPSDRLEVVLDRFKMFAVGQCQCRMTQKITGTGCDGPIQVCTVMGQWAKKGIQGGWLREVSKSEVLQIKRNAEEHGLVTWIMNVESTKGQASCSCCPCCCYAFRMVNDFNAPGVLAPAHFLPQFDAAKCTYCGKCAQKCPTHAISLDPAQKTHRYRRERCLGCGLCAVACDRQKAITMDPVPDYQLPYRSWFSMIASSVPTIAKRAWDVWRSR
jgi:Pyruvate/2-oxoacid:ferredoxin oxidoreductase delta subunit